MNIKEIREFVLINDWLFVEKEGKRQNPAIFFEGSDMHMHSLSEAYALSKEYKDLFKLQPERLNPEASKEDVIV